MLLASQAINGLIQPRFRQNLTLTEESFTDDLAGLRVSIGRSTREEDIATFISALREIVERHERRVRAA